MFRRLFTACTVTRASFFSKSRKNGTWPFRDSDCLEEARDHSPPGFMQHSGDRVLGKQMVPKRNRHGQSRGWMCLGSRRRVLTGFGRLDDQSM